MHGETSPPHTLKSVLPPDYPGRTAVFPPSVACLVYAIFGVQARVPGAGERCAGELEAHFARADGPAKIEHLRYVDPQGAHCDVHLAFWSDPQAHRRWREGAEFVAWWRTLPLTGPLGVWREMIDAHKDYYQYGAGVTERGGISALGELVPCDKFGYWGGYRDRIPASVVDRWVEMLIVKRGELANEYVNCHPQTGLLPYFEPLAVG